MYRKYKQNIFIGQEAGLLERRQREAQSVREKLQNKTLQSLASRELQLAAEYYTQEEMVQFKKPKKKVKG